MFIIGINLIKFISIATQNTNHELDEIAIKIVIKIIHNIIFLKKINKGILNSYLGYEPTSFN